MIQIQSVKRYLLFKYFSFFCIYFLMDLYVEDVIQIYMYLLSVRVFFCMRQIILIFWKQQKKISVRQITIFMVLVEQLLIKIYSVSRRIICILFINKIVRIWVGGSNFEMIVKLFLGFMFNIYRCIQNNQQYIQMYLE